MKMLLAIIQPTKLDVVREALYRIGIDRFTVCDAQGYGRQRGQTETYRGIEYQAHLLRKVAIEVVVEDEHLEKAIESLSRVARTGTVGNIGDGKVFVLPAEEFIAIDEN